MGLTNEQLYRVLVRFNSRELNLKIDHDVLNFLILNPCPMSCQMDIVETLRFQKEVPSEDILLSLIRSNEIWEECFEKEL